MNESKRLLVGFFAMVFGIVAVVAACVFWMTNRSREVEPNRDVEVVVDDASKVWLAASQSDYVGNSACTTCHEGEHETYLRTAHSQALSLVDASKEPADGDFHHEPSNRRYRVFRDEEGDMHHHESLQDETGEIIAEVDHKVDWLIGSGQHSRSYLIDDDGFLFESPVTWYEQDQSWRMSPGYDGPTHWGFERPIERGCLYCHVGTTQPLRSGYQRVAINEPAISCERCHGPGSKHVEFHESGEKVDGIDRTIVNPAHLSRERQEDVCAQCHLRGEATVTLQGKDLTDYRPGLRLADFRIDYRLRSPDGGMKVVGHVAQMRLSQCYTRSKSLTCTTCHDPHAKDESAASFQQACLQCHQDLDCGETRERRDRDAKNQCVTCHMPQSPTDIPHIAFTQHRIGIHKRTGESETDPLAVIDSAEALDELVPWSVGRIDQRQQDRLRALAYYEYSTQLADPAKAKRYQQLAKDGLEALLEKGEPDSGIDAALARIIRLDNPETAKHAALHALSQKDIDDSTKVNMLFLLCETSIRLKQYEDALQVVQDLSQLRRHSEDYYLKAVALIELAREEEAIEALQTAAAINPFRADVQLALARAYRQSGDSETADKHDRHAAKLKKAARQ